MPAAQIVEPGPNGRPCACGQRGCLEAYASASAVATIASERLNGGGLAAVVVAPGLSPSGDETDKEIGEDWGVATPPATPTHAASSPGVSRRKASLSRSDSAVSLRIREFERRASAGERGSAPGSPSTPRAAAAGSAASADAGGLTGKVTAADVFSMAKQGDEVAVRVVEETCDYLGLACVNICRVLDPDAILLTGGLSKAEGLVDKVRGGCGAVRPRFFCLYRSNERLFISAWPIVELISDKCRVCVEVQTATFLFRFALLYSECCCCVAAACRGMYYSCLLKK